MNLRFLFWFLMLLVLIFGTYWWWPAQGGARAFAPLGGSWILFALLSLLGWKVFGKPIGDA